jgi:hypothetical protein
MGHGTDSVFALWQDLVPYNVVPALNHGCVTTFSDDIHITVYPREAFGYAL